MPKRYTFQLEDDDAKWFDHHLVDLGTKPTGFILDYIAQVRATEVATPIEGQSKATGAPPQKPRAEDAAESPRPPKANPAAAGDPVRPGVKQGGESGKTAPPRSRTKPVSTFVSPLSKEAQLSRASGKRR